jgi:mannosyl-3-phosphoglycerate phosphatase
MSKTAIPAVVFVDADSAPVASASNHGDRLAGALELLAARRITIVLCSRRTRAEIESVRQALGIFHPFICERGAAAYVPERYFGSDLEKARRVGGYQAIEFGASYEVVTAALRRVADRLGLGVVGFTEMSVEQVANECGLSLLEARLAKLREYGETFRLVSSNPIAERRFLKALEGAGLICTPFGAFFDAGTAVNAGVAADRLSMLYRRALGTIVTACAGGDEWSAQIRGRVDVGLDAPAGEPTRWLESIAGNIENIRAAAVVRPAARYAR